MSEQTNNLLKLFSKLLQNPNVMFAMRAEMMSQKVRNGGDRQGARGLLVKLWEKDGLTNAEIAELLDIRPSSVTAQVKNLEQEGLVERRQAEYDGRVSLVFLTEKGREEENKRSEFHDDLSETIFGNLSEEEQNQLGFLLNKVVIDTINQEFDYDKIFEMFGQQMRQMPREMRSHFHNMQRENWKNMDANMRRSAIRDSLPFGEDWKELRRQMKERHNPWNFGQNGRKGWDGHDERDGHGENEDEWNEF